MQPVAAEAAEVMVVAGVADLTAGAAAFTVAVEVSTLAEAAASAAVVASTPAGPAPAVSMAEAFAAAAFTPFMPRLVPLQRPAAAAARGNFTPPAIPPSPTILPSHTA